MDKKIISQKIKQFELLTAESYYGHYWGEKIPSSKLSNAKKAHQLNQDYYVFFLYDKTFFGSAKESYLATDKGFSFKEDNKEPFFISWESIWKLDIGRVEDEDNTVITVEFGEGKYVVFSLYSHDALPDKFIQFIYELKEEEKSFVEDSMDYFKQNLPKTTDLIVGNLSGININKDILLNTLKRGDHFKKFCDLKPIEQEYDVTINPYQFHRFIVKHAEAFYFLEEFEQAKETLLFLVEKIEKFIKDENYESNKDDLEKFLAYDLEFIAKINEHCENYKDAIIYLSKINNFDLDGEQQRRIRSSIKVVQEKLSKSLVTNVSDARQIILCTRQIPPQTINEFFFATIDTLRSTGWKFPIGHPTENTLYVCHPLRPNQYFLIEEFLGKCFDDKYAELVYLLESLGASYIHVDVISGIIRSTSLIDKEETNLAIRDISIKKDISMQDEQSKQVQRTGSWDVSLTPNGLAYIPEDLTWFHHEPIWQRFASSCIKGNCKEFTIELSQQEDFSINSKRFHQIEGELDFFVKKLGSVKFFHREEAEKNVHQIKNTVWKIVANFSQPPVYQSCIRISSFDEEKLKIDTSSNNLISEQKCQKPEPKKSYEEKREPIDLSQITLSEKQIKKVKELKKAHEQGFLSDEDLEKEIKKVISSS